MPENETAGAATPAESADHAGSDPTTNGVACDPLDELLGYVPPTPAPAAPASVGPVLLPTDVSPVSAVSAPREEGDGGKPADEYWMSKMLRDSGIANYVIEARGYDKVHRPDDARALGFSGTACARITDEFQALIIPLYDVTGDGSRTGWQMRPTRNGPPSKDGKEAGKYVSPPRQRNMLDANPLMRPHVMGGDDPLWITEGAKKADALATVGVPCISLSGTPNWVGKERPGDKSCPSFPLPQWAAIPLKGRKVVICFDSDAATNKDVKRSREKLAIHLTARGARVEYAILDAAPDGSKQGIDDYLGVNGGKFEDIVMADSTLDAETPSVQTEIKAIKAREYIARRKAAGEKVDGHDMVQSIIDTLRRFVVFNEHEAYLAVALWAIHTHLVMEFDSTPRIAFLAPEKRCGKTRALEVLEPLIRAPRRAFNSSPAVLYSRIEEHYDTHQHPTILIDETDALFPQSRFTKSDPVKEDLRALINAGHRKGAVVDRVEMHGTTRVLREFRVYAPVALAGIGTLPETVIDRSVVIHMRRRRAGETVEPLRFRDIDKNFKGLRTDIENWVLANQSSFEGFYPEMPAGVEDRVADVWEPLIAVADRAGWGSAARACCLKLRTTDEDTVSEGVQLLIDIRRAFGDARQVAVSSAWLVDTLCFYEDTKWQSDWFTQSKLAVALRQYDIQGKTIRFGPQTLRGYEKHEFEDAWARYCPSP